MSIYHLNVKSISNKSGKSIVAKAAYRSGSRFVSQKYGQTYDYSNKGYINYTNILLPKWAPGRLKDREVLWNEVEGLTQTVDQRQAREVELALPRELTLEQQIDVAEKFVTEAFVKRGLVVDICIHNPAKRNDYKQPIGPDGLPVQKEDEMTFKNPHAHILHTINPLDKNGNWIIQKREKLYVCKLDGKEKEFTSKELKEAIEKGEEWEKQYQYKQGDKKVWLTKAEAAELGLERISRNPKSTKYGRACPAVEGLDGTEAIKELRKLWEVTCNEGLKKAGLDERIDCRSLKDQGIDRIPQIAVGREVIIAKRRAERLIAEGKAEAAKMPDLAKLNDIIKKENQKLLKMEQQIEEAVDKFKTAINTLVVSLEEIRAKYIAAEYVGLKISQTNQAIISVLKGLKGKVEGYVDEEERVKQNIDLSNRKTEQIGKELASCSVLDFGKKNELKNKLKQEVEKRGNLQEILNGLLVKYGFKNEQDFEKSKAEYESKKRELDEGKQKTLICTNEKKELKAEFDYIVKNLDRDDLEELESQRLTIREDIKGLPIEVIKNYEIEFDPAQYKKAMVEADAVLQVRKIGLDGKKKITFRH